VAVGFLGGGAGCLVKQSTYDAKVAELNETQDELTKTQGDLKATQTSLGTTQTALSGCKGDLSAANKNAQTTEAGLNAQLKQTQTQLASLATNLKTTTGQLNDLQKQQDAAQARLAEYQKLANQLQQMTKAGTISVSIRKGRMVVNLPAGVLFDPGSAEVSDAGKVTIDQVAQALGQITDRDFLVAGYTDNQPIHTNQFPSNWELSTARAVSVVEILQTAGIDPIHLAAAGYGEFDPIADNATPDGQQQNRRIEVIIMPNLDELPHFPGEDSSGNAAANASPPPTTPTPASPPPLNPPPIPAPQ
jgi:chemotaxis protein MotB